MALFEALRQLGADYRRSVIAATAVAACTATPFFVAEQVSLAGLAWFVPVVTGIMAWYWAIRYVRDISAKIPLQAPSAELIEIVVELSSRVGMHAPRLGVVPSGGALMTYAWSGCLASPVMMFSDGFLHRLSPDEQRAVIAHELGHFKTRSLWVFLCVGGVSAVICTALATRADPLALCLLAWPLAEVMKRLVSRPFEYACDAVAAKHASPEAMAGALRTIESLQPFNSDWRVVPLRAVDGHPTSPARIARLLKTPLDQPLSHTIAPWIALALALLLMAIPLVGNAFWVVTVVCLGVVVLAPRGFLKLAQTDVDRRRRRLIPDRHPETVKMIVATGVAVALIILQAAVPGVGLSLLVAPALLAVLYFALKRRQRIGLRHRVAVALGAKNFEEAIRIGTTHPKWLSQDPIGRHDVSLAQLMGGDWQTGLDGLRTAAEMSPGFLLPWVNLVGAQLWTEPATALADARVAVESAPDSAEALTALAGALVESGDGQLAEEKICRALELGRPGQIVPVAARIALRNGDLERCRERLQEAQKVAPGDPYATLVEAELLLLTGDIDAAKDALNTAKSALEQIPIHLVGPWVVRLEGKISPPCPIPQSPT